MKILMKRTYEEADKSDGFRILADRLWPRGIKKENAHIDLWAKEISPSTDLRKSYHSYEIDFKEFSKEYLKELKDSGEGITPKAWQREIDQLTAGKQTDTLAMKSMREDLKAVERLRKTAEQLSRQERDKSHDREPER